MSRFEKFYPLVEWGSGHFVKVVHAQYVVFRKQVARLFSAHKAPLIDTEELLVLTDGEFENVMWFMRTPKFCLAVIHIVFALAQFEIDDVDGIDFTHLVVGASQPNIFRDGL